MALKDTEIPATQINTPALNAKEIVPADADLTNYTRGIYVGGTGDLTVMTIAGDTVTFKAVPIGVVIPIVAKQIRATLTTATLIVAMW